MHAASRTRTGQFAPQNRRQVKADKIIKRTARQIGIHQFLIKFARIGDGFGDSFLGDLVKHDAMDIATAEQLFLLENFKNMPGNGFTFAIRVSREVDGVRVTCRRSNFLDLLFGTAIGFPDH